MMNNRMKRILTYRVLSILSEYIVVFIVTGSFIIPAITTPICIVTHTGIHYAVERLFS